MPFFGPRSGLPPLRAASLAPAPADAACFFWASMRCFSASICERSESNPEAFFAPITGAGFGAEDAEPFCFLLLRWRSASSTACFFATSAMALAWRARARASAASRATRSFSLSIWLARLSNGDEAGALAGLRPSGEPSPPCAPPSASAASRRARSASRAARSCSTASRRARSSSALRASASARSRASSAASSASSWPARCLISGSRFFLILAT